MSLFSGHLLPSQKKKKTLYMLHKQESLSRLKGSSFGSSAETFYRLAVCGVHVNAFIYSSEFWFDKRKRPGSMSNTIPISKWTSWIHFCGFLCLGNVQWHHSVFIYCTPVWETRTGENSIMYFSRFIPTLCLFSPLLIQILHFHKSKFGLRSDVQSQRQPWMKVQTCQSC